MKRSELIFNLASLPVDSVMVLLAGIASFNSRIRLKDFVGPIIYQLDLHSFVVSGAKVLPILVIIFALLGLYNLRGTRRFYTEVGKIMLGVTVALFLVIILFFFNHTVFPSRFIILASWVYATVFVIIGRLLLRLLQRWLFNKKMGLHRLVIVNGNHTESRVIKEALMHRMHGYEVIKEFDYSSTVVGELETLIRATPFDEIMQANPGLPDEANLALVEFAKQRGLQFSFVPNLFEVQRNVVEVGSLQGVPVISLKNTPLDGWGKVAKRVIDIIASAACLILLSPLFLVLYIAIKFDTHGSAIYPALRGGRGRDFVFYKFRSMYAHLSVGNSFGGVEAEKLRQQLWEKNDRGGKEGPFLKIKNDPRVTRVGKFLRKTKLDEIPQFWNVLKGDMSMVGPRAHVLDEVGKYRDAYQRMFSIKPGIFGMSQVAQTSWPDLPFEEEIRLNTYYIENWSLWLDLKVLFQSFYLLFFAKKPNEDY